VILRSGREFHASSRLNFAFRFGLAQARLHGRFVSEQTKHNRKFTL